MKSFVLATLGFALTSASLHASDAPEQKTLDSTGIAVVCASEHTGEVEDVTKRLDQKLGALKGTFDISVPVFQRVSSGGSVGYDLCVSVTKRK